MESATRLTAGKDVEKNQLGGYKLSQQTCQYAEILHHESDNQRKPHATLPSGVAYCGKNVAKTHTYTHTALPTNITQATQPASQPITMPINNKSQNTNKAASKPVITISQPAAEPPRDMILMPPKYNSGKSLGENIFKTHHKNTLLGEGGSLFLFPVNVIAQLSWF